MQFPSPSVVSPDGHGLGSGVESETQFPFPSLLNPVAHTAGIEDATQFPSPSDLKPVGQTSFGTEADAKDIGEVGSVIGMHPPWLSVSNPDAHEVNEESSGTQFPFPSDKYPYGQTLGVATVSGMQFPFPSLW